MTTKDFEEYAKFCDDESVEKDYAIKDSTEQVETLGATITDATGGITSATAALKDMGVSGKNSVIFFYGADDAPSCSKEIAAFDSELAAFAEKGVSVV